MKFKTKMSLAWLLRRAKNYEQRYNLIKAIYEIQPDYGELTNLMSFMSSDEDWIIYDNVQEILKELVFESNLDDTNNSKTSPSQMKITNNKTSKT